MNSKKPNSVEEQFRSSQVYKTLSGAGPVSEKVAQSLEKVTAVLDTTIHTVDQSLSQVNIHVNNAMPNPSQRPPVNQAAGRPYYKPPKAPRPAPPNYGGRPVPPPNQFRQGSKYKPVPGPGQHIEKIKKTNVWRYVATGITAVMAASNMDFYDAGDFVGFFIMLAIVFGITSAIFKDKKTYMLVDDVRPVAPPQPAPQPRPEKAKEEPKKSRPKTGDPEADELIDEGYDMLENIRVLGVDISDESIRQCVARMDRAFTGILEYIIRNPKKASQVRRFMNYYLPTSIKLLQTYQRLDKQAVKGENIRSSMEDIDRFMYTVADAFEKQLDSLFSDEAMDISADISVFETMLKQEGLQEEELRVEPRE